jgi:hypothetical protein
VMQVAASGRDKVRTQRRFLVPDQQPVAPLHGSISVA